MDIEILDAAGASSAFDKLLKYRTIMLVCDVEEYVIAEIMANMMLMEKDDPNEPIHLWVGSWGGSLADGLGIYDLIKNLACPVNTYAIGKACSAGALILAAGTGVRKAYPNARIMIHQPSGGFSMGTMTDNKIASQNDDDWKRMFIEATAESTGQSYKKILRDCIHDKWMSAEEAMAYGIVDEVVTLHRKKPLTK